MRHLFGDSFSHCASVSHSSFRDAINDKMEVVKTDSTLILEAITLRRAFCRADVLRDMLLFSSNLVKCVCLQQLHSYKQVVGRLSKTVGQFNLFYLKWVFLCLRSTASLLSSNHSHSSHCFTNLVTRCTSLLPKLPPQPQLSPAKTITHPNRTCFDCHLITHRFTPQFTSQKEGPAGVMWRGGGLGWMYGGPGILSINVGRPNKGPHDRG